MEKLKALRATDPTVPMVSMFDEQSIQEEPPTTKQEKEFSCHLGHINFFECSLLMLFQFKFYYLLLYTEGTPEMESTFPEDFLNGLLGKCCLGYFVLIVLYCLSLNETLNEYLFLFCFLDFRPDLLNKSLLDPVLGDFSNVHL